MRRSTDLVLSPLCRPQLAPLYTRARCTWGRLSDWAAAHLPDASRSIGPPATAEQWATFVGWLQLEGHETGVLPLQLLASVHDGQRFSTDATIAARQVRTPPHARRGQPAPGTHPHARGRRALALQA